MRPFLITLVPLLLAGCGSATEARMVCSVLSDTEFQAAYDMVNLAHDAGVSKSTWEREMDGACVGDYRPFENRRGCEICLQAIVDSVY